MNKISTFIRRVATAALAIALSALSAKAQQFVSPISLRWQSSSRAEKTIFISVPEYMEDDSLGFRISIAPDSHFSVSPASMGSIRSGADVNVTPVSINSGHTDIEAELTVTLTSFGEPFASQTVSLTHIAAPLPEPEPEPEPIINYIKTTTFLSPSGTRFRQDVSYYDGLGYLTQSQAVAASPSGRSIITPVIYDNMRRADARTLLPYVSASGSTGAFEDGAVNLQSGYYSGDSSPYAQKTFEPHAAGRVTSALREGDAWHGANRRSTFEYGFNSAEDAVMKFSYNPSTTTVTCGGSYSAASLTKTTSTDEDGHTSVSFNTPRGKTLLSRQFSGSGSSGTASDTYFIYDLRDSLVCVIQPEGAAALAARTNATLTLKESASYANNDIYSAYCFSWKYDPWGNVLESHVPGGGTTEFTYDDRNRLVTEQTPRIRELGMERAMVYDECNRPTLEHYRRQDSNELISISHTWDYYPFATEPSFPRGEGACGGLLRHERVYDAPSGDGPGAGYVDRYYHYDDRSRVIRVEEYDEDENLSDVTTTYDFVGNVISTTETQQQGGECHTLHTEYSYDDRGRVTCMSRSLDDCPLADVFYSYDELGRLFTKTTGGGTLSEAYSYDIHSWKTGSTALVNGQTVFSQDLRYNAPLTGGHAGLYNGNISEGSVWYAGQDGSTVNTAYSYDGLNRLTDAAHPDNTERSILYDRNGNITGLTRYGEAGTAPENVTFSHLGNRLSSVGETPASLANGLYRYDPAGNLTYDPRKGLHFCYNVANLPSSVRRDGEDSSLITYRYLSDGTKISAEVVLEPEIDEGDGIIPAKIYRRRYKGSFTYVTDPDTGEETLESIAWNEGMIYLRKMAEPSETVDTLGVIDGDIVVDVMDTLAVFDLNNRMIYDRWFVKDHLGNVRTVVELGSHVGEIVEQDDYLPFGTRFTPATQGVICTMDTELYGCEHDNRYRYAGKEEQRFGPQIDLALLDFGARSYDPFAARWTSIDPLAHKYLGLSPYNYCSGNPVMYFDPDGMGNIDWKTVGEGSALIAGGTVSVAGAALVDYGTGGFAALATAGLITNGVLSIGTGMTMVAAGFIGDEHTIKNVSNVPNGVTEMAGLAADSLIGNEQNVCQSVGSYVDILGSFTISAVLEKGITVPNVLSTVLSFSPQVIDSIDDQLSNVPQNTSNIRQESPSWVEEVQKNYPIYLDWRKYDNN